MSEASSPAFGRIALANFSIGLSFVLSLAVSPGTLFVEFILDGPVLWEMTGIARQLPSLLGNYWIPAVVIYLVLRYRRVQGRYRVSPAAHKLVGVGNAMLLTYIFLRLEAVTIPGGGAGFVVASIGSIALALPGYLCLAIGLLRAALTRVTNVERAKVESEREVRLGTAEGLMVIAATAVPVACFIWLYAGDQSPFRLAREAEQVLNERCRHAGERIIRTLNGVKSLYLERDEAFMLDGLRNGVYAGIAFGSLGKAMLDRGFIEFYEIRRPSGKRAASTTEEYLRFNRNDNSPEITKEVLSKHTFLWRDIATPAEKRLGISGGELAIADRESGERIATAIFYISSRHRKICGSPEGRSYGVIQFIERVIGSPTNEMRPR